MLDCRADVGGYTANEDDGATRGFKRHFLGMALSLRATNSIGTRLRYEEGACGL